MKKQKRKVIDISSERSFFEEREKAKQRDKCCQLCGAKEPPTALTIHHTLFPRFRYARESRRDKAKYLLILCNECHQWFHQYFYNQIFYVNKNKSEEFCNLCGIEDSGLDIQFFEHTASGSERSITLCESCKDASYNHNPKLKGGGWYR